MKKSLFLIAAALIASLALTGCGDNTADTAATADGADTEAAENVSYDAVADFAKDADKNIDMAKVEGTDATTADDENASGEVGDTKITITDAKVIDYNGKDVIIVSFEFKNNTGDTTSFAASAKAEAEQAGTPISITTVVDVEGIDCNTIAQQVKKGDTITVQKAFRLSNTTDPVTIYVNEPTAVSETGAVSKTFNLQ